MITSPMLSPLETIHEYYSVFSTLDVNAIASYYLEPCLSIGTRAVFSAASRADVARAFAPFIERLREKAYRHSEFVQPQITILTDTAALVRGFAVRYCQIWRRDRAGDNQLPAS